VRFGEVATTLQEIRQCVQRVDAMAPSSEQAHWRNDRSETVFLEILAKREGGLLSIGDRMKSQLSV
jgi:hypothetical protein